MIIKHYVAYTYNYINYTIYMYIYETSYFIITTLLSILLRIFVLTTLTRQDCFIMVCLSVLSDIVPGFASSHNMGIYTKGVGQLFKQKLFPQRQILYRHRGYPRL